MLVTNRRKQILVVARWPLGGIRTYMLYMFRHFPQEYQLTVLASTTHEDSALKQDAAEYGARLIIVQPGCLGLACGVFGELWHKRSDLILSQGFISAVSASLANIFFKVPHVLTIHGIVEPKYFSGRFGRIKHFVLGKIFANITALYAVSNDMLSNVYEQFASLKKTGVRAVVIHNGIELPELEMPSDAPSGLRAKLKISEETFIFGFFGRFMPQKGFDLLIEAIGILNEQKRTPPCAVLAVGTDDYLSRYQKMINDKGLEKYFYFLPFQPQVHRLYREVNAIVMPSRWEASGLLAMEALCMGRPLIAADCIGLRETVADTPAMSFLSENVAAFAKALERCLLNSEEEKFVAFAPIARERFHVKNSARQLLHLLDELCSSPQT